MHRLTKIVATLGPASSDEPRIDELIAAGTDVFRLNFSHGTHDQHAQLLARVRAASRRAGRHVAILQDLSGPKIRTGLLAGHKAIPLKHGDTLVIETGNQIGEPGRVSTTYAELARAVRAGDRLLLDDGRVELQVESTDGTRVTTTIVNGDELGEHKGINAPGVELPTSAMTAKDLDDLRFGLDQGVDMVALSFVQTAADVIRARDLIAAHKSTRLASHAGGLAASAADGSVEPADAHVPVIAKIERPMAVQNIDEILAHCDGVMVARGDLGLEMPFERVPRVQKEITRCARVRGLPVIVATQVFDSMRSEPRPTRAEVSDAANAVDDAVDAIMMSGETAVGAYPMRTVQTLDAVIRDAESIRPSLELTPRPDVVDVEHNRALCEAACTLASAGQAVAIVAVTRAGKTARMLSAFRPRVPIFAVSPYDTVARRLALYRGVTPLALDLGGDLEVARWSIEHHLVTRGLLTPGDVIVFVSVNADLTRPDANFLRIRRVGEP